MSSYRPAIRTNKDSITNLTSGDNLYFLRYKSKENSINRLVNRTTPWPFAISSQILLVLWQVCGFWVSLLLKMQAARLANQTVLQKIPAKDTVHTLWLARIDPTMLEKVSLQWFASTHRKNRYLGKSLELSSRSEFAEAEAVFVLLQGIFPR